MTRGVLFESARVNPNNSKARCGMRRIVDALTWVFVVIAVSVAVYFTATRADVSAAGLADHNHRSEAQRAACQSCRYDVIVDEID